MSAFWNFFIDFCFVLFVNVDVDPVPNRKTSSKGVERMLEFGRELFQLGQRLEKDNEANETNQKMLEVIMMVDCRILFFFLFLLKNFLFSGRI